MDREGDTGLRRQRSTDTHTQGEGEERTTNQTANSLRSTEGSRNSSITTLLIQQSKRETCLFLYQIYLSGGEKITEHLSGKSKGKKTTSRSRKTRSCRIKDRRWMLLVLL